MSDGKDVPGAVRKKRFPASLKIPSAVPAPTKKLWDAVGGKKNPVQNSVPMRLKGVNEDFFVCPTAFSGSIGGMSGARERMVQRLYKQGIRHEAVLQAMRKVPREIFVDSALTSQAYEDTSLPIGLGQTISKPSVVARMLELLVSVEGKKLRRVLDIGTGCGYQAAVLSHLVGEVYSMERIRGLHERARANLRPLRLRNVHLIYGDGMLGFPSGAPYDAIIAAAGGQRVPVPWLEQLSENGCLIAPIETKSGVQSLVKVVRTEQGWQQYELEAVQFVPLKSGVL